MRPQTSFMVEQTAARPSGSAATENCWPNDSCFIGEEGGMTGIGVGGGAGASGGTAAAVRCMVFFGTSTSSSSLESTIASNLR